MLLLELAITFPDELSPNTDPGERRGVGAAKLCAPPAAYAENALVARAGVLWRDGERLRAKRLLDGGGDFGRFAALAKGEVEDAKASKPVRLWACGADEEDVSLAATAAANGEGEVLVDANGDVTLLPPMAFGLEIEPALAHEEVDGCLAPNMRGPCTEAKGELVDAYAANPPWVQYKARLANEDGKRMRTLTNFGGETEAGVSTFFSACSSSSGGGVGRFFSRVFGSASGSSLGRFVAPTTTVPFLPGTLSPGTKLSLTVRSPSLRLRPFSWSESELRRDGGRREVFSEGCESEGDVETGDEEGKTAPEGRGAPATCESGGCSAPAAPPVSSIIGGFAPCRGGVREVSGVVASSDVELESDWAREACSPSPSAEASSSIFCSGSSSTPSSFFMFCHLMSSTPWLICRILVSCGGEPLSGTSSSASSCVASRTTSLVRFFFAGVRLSLFSGRSGSMSYVIV